MCQIIRLNKQDLFQFSIPFQKQSKCELVYYDVLIIAFYVYIIIKMPAPLALPVNNRDRVLIKASIRYAQNGVREKKFNGRWVLFK